MKNVSPNHNTKNHRHLQKISTNAIEKFSLQQSNNFFDRGYLLWKHQLRSRQRNIIKVLTCASLLGSGGYTTSPQLSPLLFQNIHQTSYHIADTLNAYGFRPGDTIYQSNDQETNIIMDIMAGYGNNPAFNQMLHTYKYDTLIPIDKFCHKDPALYKALRKIYEKYGNPHLTIGASAKDYMTGETFPERGFLHPIQNQIRMYDITEGSRVLEVYLIMNNIASGLLKTLIRKNHI